MYKVGIGCLCDPSQRLRGGAGLCPSQIHDTRCLSHGRRKGRQVRPLPICPGGSCCMTKSCRRSSPLRLEENKDLKRAVATIEEFQARLFVSRTDFAPQLSGSVNAPAFGRKTSFLFPGFASPFNYYLSGQSFLGVGYLGADPAFE